MANLQVEQTLSATVQSVKDENGNTSPLALSTEAVGIGTTNPEARLHIHSPDNDAFKVTNSALGKTLRIGVDQLGAWLEPTEQNSSIRLNANPSLVGLLIDGQTGNVGIGTRQVGKTLEVVGNIVSRDSSEANRTAVALTAEANGLCSLWTNNAYDPSRSGSGWRRTINMVNGNVGIGRNIQNPQERLEVDGNILATGDVRLAGADCAEDFDVDEQEALDPGMVMIIGDEERLRQCHEAYDKRVAGVLSGAGDCHPGILLGTQQSSRHRRLPLALTGKVYCKVDAHYAPIGVGDLLTTSPTRGHAMRASDPARAFGAIIGKALRPFTQGQGVIPILVALQ